MRTSGSISSSTFGARPSVRASIASTALLTGFIFANSNLRQLGLRRLVFFLDFRERLGIGTLHSAFANW